MAKKLCTVLGYGFAIDFIAQLKATELVDVRNYCNVPLVRT
jgi:hypothetical protein